MKKDSAYTLATMTFVFAALLFGILIGREMFKGDVYYNIPDTNTVAPTKFIENTEASTEATEVTGKKININTATVEELDALPGIGPTYAERIIEYRTKNGTFKDVSELMNISGIGQKTLDKILEYITVED